MIKNYTVRDIAEELSVSKPTVSKAITELNLRLEKVGNRFVLSEEQFVLIKSQITKKSESEISEKMQISQNDESQKSEKMQITQNDESQKSENELPKSQNQMQISQIETLKSEIESLKSTISFLEGQITFHQQQLVEKDQQNNSQLAEKDKQIAVLHEQNKSLTDALVAAQTLHAATIQTVALEDKSAVPERKGFFRKIFRK